MSITRHFPAHDVNPSACRRKPRRFANAKKRREHRERLALEMLESRWMLASDIEISAVNEPASYQREIVGQVVTYRPIVDLAQIGDSTIVADLQLGRTVIVDTANDASTLPGDIHLSMLFTTFLSDSIVSTLDLRANNDVVVDNTTIDVEGIRVNLVLNSDRDEDGFGAVAINANNTLSLNGGNLTIGGGTDPASQPSRGTSNRSAGVSIEGSINTQGGNVSVRGEGFSDPLAVNSHGVALGDGVRVQAGVGTVELTGTSGVTDQNQVRGISIGSDARVATTSGSIMVDGVSRATGNEAVGVEIFNVIDSGLTSITTESGDITISGEGSGSSTSDAFGLRLSSFAGNALIQSTGQGAVLLQAVQSGSALGLSLDGDIGGATSSGDIRIAANDILLSQGSGTIQSAGNLTFLNVQPQLPIEIGGADVPADSNTPSLKLSSAGLETLTDGFASITFGSSESNPSPITIENVSLNDPLVVDASSVAFAGTVSAPSVAVTSRDSDSTSNDLILAEGAVVEARTGALSFTAGDAFIQQASASLIASTNLTIDVDQLGNETTGAGGTVSLLGALSIGGNVQVSGGTDADEFVIDPASAAAYTLTAGANIDGVTDRLRIVANSESASLDLNSNLIEVNADSTIATDSFEILSFDNPNILTIQGSDSVDETFDFAADPVLPSVDRVSVGGVSIELDSANELIVSGGLGDDTFTFDAVDQVPSTPVTFNGQASSSSSSVGDGLVVRGSFSTQTFNYFPSGIDGNNGSVVLDGSLINYTGLEPITGGDSADTVLNLATGASNSASLANSTALGFIEWIDLGTTFEDTVFPNPSNSLTINLGDNGDTLAVSSLDAGYAASLVINGGTGVDSVTVDQVTIADTPGRGLDVSTVESLQISDSTFTGNTADVGGGIRILGGVASISNSTVTGNTSTVTSETDPLAGGGAIFTTAELTVSGSTIANNQAGSAGGGVLVRDGGSLSISSSTISNNTAGRGGGGIALLSASATIDSTTIDTNQAVIGAGISVETSSLVVRSSTVSNNTASALASPGSPHLVGFGGGLAIVDGSSVQIENSTISGNSAATDGGGLIVGVDNNGSSLQDTLQLTHATVVNNQAGTGSGGGLLISGSGGSPVTMVNSIIAGNTRAMAASDIESAMASVDATASTGNFVGDPITAGGLVDGQQGNIVGDGAGNVVTIERIIDPVLQNNGGPTLTHALAIGSQAVDAASSTAVLLLDQTGSPRPVDGDANGTTVADIGAVESQTAMTGIIRGVKFNDLNGNGNDQSGTDPRLEGVTFVVSDANNDAGESRIVVSDGSGVFEANDLPSSQYFVTEAPLTVESFEVIGANTPAAVDEPVAFDGFVNVVSNDQLVVRERVNVISDSEQWIEVSFDALNGQLAGDVDSNWFANFRITTDQRASITESYLYFREQGTPRPIDDFATRSHPFDSTVTSINDLADTRDAATTHRLGIFSNPFRFFFSDPSADPDPADITGLTLGYRFVTDEPDRRQTTALLGQLAVNSNQIVTAPALSSGSPNELVVDELLVGNSNTPAVVGIESVSVDEGIGSATVNLRLTGSTSIPLTVDVTTADIGEAVAGLDYVAQTQTLTFAGTDGEVQSISIPIIEDQIVEPDESFAVQITSVSEPSSIVQVTDPVSVSLNATATADTIAGATDVRVVDDIAFTAVGIDGVQVIDFSDQQNPVTLATFDNIDFAHQIEIDTATSTAFVAANRSGLMSVDVSDPSMPIELDLFRTGSGNTGLVNSFVISGDRAYLAGGSAGAVVVDISDVASISEISSTDISTFVMSVDVLNDASGDFLFAVDSSNQLTVIDIADETSPQIITSVDLQSLPETIEIVGPTLYVGTHAGIKIFDVSDPANPALMNEVSTTTRFDRFVFVGDRLFAAGGSTGVRVFDVVTRSLLVEVGSVASGDFVENVEVVGNQVFAASGPACVKVFDIDETSFAPVSIRDNDIASSVTASDSVLNLIEDGPTQSLDLSSLVTTSNTFGETTITLLAVERGTATIVDGTLSYTPDADDFTTDPLSLVYAAENSGASDTGTILINIAPVNDVPTAVDDTIFALPGQQVVIPLSQILGNDLAGPANETTDALNFQLLGTFDASGLIANTIGRGSVEFNGVNVIYTPQAKYFGNDSFNYQITDGGAPDLTATATVNVSVVDANSLAAALLGDPQITISNASLTAVDGMAGFFIDGASEGLGIDRGLILSTGRVGDALGPNLNSGTTTDFSASGDDQLAQLVDAQTDAGNSDAAILEFDFQVPFESRISFEYIFASEEYNEFVGSRFNDVFGFFLDGENIALIPGQSEPVSINSLNAGSNSQFFVNNEGPEPRFASAFDGFTTVLEANTGTLTPGQVYRLRLGVVDVSDSAFDSAVLLRGNSFGIGQSDVQIVGSASEDQVDPGETVTFSYQVTNAGQNTSSNTGFTATFPLAATVLSASTTTGTLIRSNNGVAIELSDLLLGDQATIDVVVQMPNFDATVQSLASISASQFDPVTVNNAVSLFTTVGNGGAGIAGLVSCDANSNGMLDSGETVAGIEVFVDQNFNLRFDSGEPSAITGSDGSYLISGVTGDNLDVLSVVPLSCSALAQTPAVDRRAVEIGSLARSIANVDIDQDGDLDLLTVSDLSGELTVLNNSGLGDFTVGQSIPLGDRPQSITTSLPAPNASPLIAVAGIGTSSTTGSLFTLAGGLPATQFSSPGSIDVIIDSLDGGSDPDFVTANFRDSTLEFRFNGQSTPVRIQSQTQQLISIASGNLDSDTTTRELVAIGYGFEQAHLLDVLSVGPDGAITQLATAPISANTVQVEFGAVLTPSSVSTGVGSEQLVVLDEDGSVLVFRMEGGQIQDAIETAVSPGASSMALGDFNNDSIVDVAVANLGNQTIEILIGSGDGRFANVTTVQNISAPSALTVGDFDQNGFDEIAVASLYSDASLTNGDSNNRFTLPSSVTILQLRVAQHQLSISTETINQDIVFNGADPLVLFDVNGDQSVTASDALVVINSLTSVSTPAGAQSRTIDQDVVTDVNGDGTTTARDALLIINHLMNESEDTNRSTPQTTINDDRVETDARRVRLIDDVFASGLF